jgi:hypothetical protein
VPACFVYVCKWRDCVCCSGQTTACPIKERMLYSSSKVDIFSHVVVVVVIVVVVVDTNVCVAC